MNKTDKLEAGMVVQLSPTIGYQMFACCFMVITEPKDFGAQGYVQSFGENSKMGGQAYYRANWDEMELVGEAVWLLTKKEKNNE